jgi:NAD(P)-dependent dehydrogenase (short-subunit alcohol dehydrogenase family)
MATALIVGASRGLGRALAEEHLKRGWTVIATVRDPSALADLAASHPGKLQVELLDTIDWAGVDALRERLSGRVLDLLFVNAGILGGPRDAPIGEVSGETFAELMLVNALAPLRLLDRFIALTPEDGVAAVMTSGLASVANNTSGGYEAYRMSKAALNTGLRSLAVRHASGARAFLAVAPGWVRTDMGGDNAPLSIEQSIPSLTDMLERRRGAGGVAFVDYQDVEMAW